MGRTKKFDLFVIFIIITILTFIIIALSVASVKIIDMGFGTFFVESVLPLPYWVGLAVIACMGYYMLRYLDEKRYQLLLIILSIIMMICFRLAFPVMFTSIPAYEPDAVNYIKIVSSWVGTGVDFVGSGHYEHDYPVAFLMAFVFIKLGVPFDLFFRGAPFALYALDVLLVFLIVDEITQNKRLSAVSSFLFSFTSLGYWVTVHYCPDLVGSTFFLIALFFSLRFAKKGEWSLKALAPAFLSLVVLVLTHHLSTLYFILSELGLALATWFFNPPQLKGKALSFFIIGILTYTFWFAYGTLMYPDFFNLYSYFGGGSAGNPTSLALQADLFTNLSFAIYPVFILGLFGLEFLKVLKIKDFLNVKKWKNALKEIRSRESSNFPLVFVIGFILVLGLFFTGFVLPVSFPERILEVLCIASFPLSSQSFLRIYDKSISKKRKLLFYILLIVLLLVVLTGVHRYYSQIQRRVITN